MIAAEEIEEAIGIALTHAVTEVADHAAAGLSYLAGEGHAFALQCVAALARQGRLMSQRVSEERLKPWAEQVSADELAIEVAAGVRDDLRQGDLDAPADLASLSFEEWPGRVAIRRILMILGASTDADLALTAFSRVTEALIRAWDEDRSSWNFELEMDLVRELARFSLTLSSEEALALCDPIIGAVDPHPDEVHEFVRALVRAEDGQEAETPFWDLWQALAQEVQSAGWAEHLAQERLWGAELVRDMFLGLEWKKGVDHWSRLTGHADRIDDLFCSLPSGPCVMAAYVTYLSTIGTRALPGAFILLTQQLRAGDAGATLATGDLVFTLEKLLSRFVYGAPLAVKSNRPLADAVLWLLDELVEVGSSAAYVMRDDFVTPIPAQGVPGEPEAA
jgi:hypothetical protein